MRLGNKSQLSHSQAFTAAIIARSMNNTVEGLVKLLHIMTSGGRLEAWLIAPCVQFTSCSEGLGTSLVEINTHNHS